MNQEDPHGVVEERRSEEERMRKIRTRREELLRDALALADLKAKVSAYEKEMAARIADQADDDPAYMDAWRYRVIDLSRVPVEFQGVVIRTVNDDAVNALIRYGVREIPGIEIALKKLYPYRRKQPDWDHS